MASVIPAALLSPVETSFIGRMNLIKYPPGKRPSRPSPGEVVFFLDYTGKIKSYDGTSGVVSDFDNSVINVTTADISDMSADARTRATKTDAEVAALLAILPQITSASTWAEIASGEPVVYAGVTANQYSVNSEAEAVVVNIGASFLTFHDLGSAHSLVVNPGEIVCFSSTDVGAGHYTFAELSRVALCPDASSTVAGKISTGTQTLAGAKTITFGGYTESPVALGTVTSTATLTITAGTVITATLTASTACTFAMPTATAGKSFTLLLKQAAATGLGTATFTGAKWDAGGTPVVTPTAGKMDIFTFTSDGANWYGSVAKGFTP